MSDSQEQKSSFLCLVVCILLGVLAGFIAWYLLRPLMSLWASIPIGMFVAFCSSWMLDEVFCKGSAVAEEVSPAVQPNEGQVPAAASLASPKTKVARKKSASSGKASKGTAKKSTAAPKLFKSRPSNVDDLKMIAGVGPKLEGVLHEVGVYQFEQIASWKKKDIEYVDERLKFKGRIERDQWVKQAKALAKGGEAEYVKVFGKKPR